MKTLLGGIVLILVIGIGGLVYRNVLEHTQRPIACPQDALLCPDGTAVARTGISCEFPACPPPNVTLASAGISFAVPSGLDPVDTSDPTALAVYASPDVASSTLSGRIEIREFPIAASSTALATIQETAIGGASGEPVNPNSFSSTFINNRQFTVVQIERFEGMVTTAYYLKRKNDVLRFDAIDQGVDWTNPNLVVANLPVHAALVKLLSTMQVEP